MPLPPKSKGKKKRKRMTKRASQRTIDGQEVEESEEEEDTDEEEDEDGLDKLIAKKFPDFKIALSILEELEKVFPQTGINGD